MLQNEFKLKTLLWPSYKMAIRYKQGPSLPLMDDLSDPGPLFGKWIFFFSEKKSKKLEVLARRNTTGARVFVFEL